MSEKENGIDVVRIMEMIPHRYPFLMIDRMIDVIPDESAVSIKNVSINELASYLAVRLAYELRIACIMTR